MSWLDVVRYAAIALQFCCGIAFFMLAVSYRKLDVESRKRAESWRRAGATERGRF